MDYEIYAIWIFMTLLSLYFYKKPFPLFLNMDLLVSNLVLMSLLASIDTVYFYPIPNLIFFFLDLDLNIRSLLKAWRLSRK